MSGEHYVTISKIIPMVYCLNKQLNSFDTSSQNVASLKQCLEAEMVKRFCQVELNSKLAMATILDPRFKNIHFQNPVACSRAINKLKTVSVARDSSSSGESEEERPNEKKFDFWKCHKELAHGKNKRRNKEDTSEISLFLANPVSSIKSNPLELWEDMKHVFPGLYKQARTHLVSMATSVPCERLFSKAGATVTTQRNRLTGKHIEKLIFLSSIADSEWFH